MGPDQAPDSDPKWFSIRLPALKNAWGNRARHVWLALSSSISGIRSPPHSDFISLYVFFSCGVSNLGISLSGDVKSGNFSIWGCKSGIWGVKSWIWGIKSGNFSIWGCKSGIWDVKSGIWDLKSGIWDVKSGIWDLILEVKSWILGYRFSQIWDFPDLNFPRLEISQIWIFPA